MRLPPLRTASICGSFALAAALASFPAQGRGQQAEQFALLAFVFLVGAVSLIGDRSRARVRRSDATRDE